MYARLPRAKGTLAADRALSAHGQNTIDIDDNTLMKLQVGAAAYCAYRHGESAIGSGQGRCAKRRFLAVVKGQLTLTIEP